MPLKSTTHGVNVTRLKGKQAMQPSSFASPKIDKVDVIVDNAPQAIGFCVEGLHLEVCVLRVGKVTKGQLHTGSSEFHSCVNPS